MKKREHEQTETPTNPDLPMEVLDAVRGLGLTPADVASWRIEGRTLIVIETSGAKHRGVRIANREQRIASSK